ncbi:formyl-CoA transferase domain protein [Mycobacterium kansasii]|uniref:Formyl-CoA transferase domain protein n=1 Tax=Mycobacterium kansasii TaxID=1768 RepID=A0A1V3XH20_MYCKA|nr:formyl-CoA transferase domain protein [Mycobacterium kansasii]
MDGVRVIDLTAFWAGPAATHLLAAFGADVVKVESIQRPDGIRYSGACAPMWTTGGSTAGCSMR